MKPVFLTLVLLFFLKTSHCQNDNLYSGGMLFFQPGFLKANTQFQEINDNSSGLGGIIRFYFLKNLTVGVFGGTFKTHYNTSGSDKSYFSLGYGGPFAGLSLKKKKFRYTLSVFAGPGKISNLHIEKQSNINLDEAYIYNKSTFIFSPLVSADYYLTEKILICLQAVYLKNRAGEELTFSNTAIQIGVLFCR